MLTLVLSCTGYAHEITLNSPENGTNFYENNVSFSFTPSGSDPDYLCKLYIDGQKTGNMAEIANYEDYGMACDVLSDGTYVYVAELYGGLSAYLLTENGFELKGQIKHIDIENENSTGYSYLCTDGAYIYAVEENTYDYNYLKAYTFNGTDFEEHGSLPMLGEYIPEFDDYSGYNPENMYYSNGYICTEEYYGDLHAYTFNGTDFTEKNVSDCAIIPESAVRDENYVYKIESDSVSAYTFNGTGFELNGTVNCDFTPGKIYTDENYIYIFSEFDYSADNIIEAYTFNGTDFEKCGNNTFEDSEEAHFDGTYFYVSGEYYVREDYEEYFGYYPVYYEGISAYTFNGTDFELKGSVQTSLDCASPMYSDENYLYIVGYDEGLHAYTFNGTGFELKGQTEDDFAYSVSTDGNYIYLANGYAGLSAYEFDGSEYTLKRTVDNDQKIRDVYCDNGYIYAVAPYDGLYAYTFNGTDFEKVAFTNITEDYVRAIYANVSYVYVAAENGYLYAYTFNGTDFELKATGEGEEVCGYKNYIITTGYNGLFAYSFEGIALEEKIFLDGGGSTDYGVLYSDGEYIYLNNGSYLGAYTFNGTDFELKGNYETYYTCDIYSDGNYIYVADEGSFYRAVVFPTCMDILKFDGSEFTRITTAEETGLSYNSVAILGGGLRSVCGDGEYIYAAAGDGGIKAYEFGTVSKFGTVCYNNSLETINVSNLDNGTHNWYVEIETYDDGTIFSENRTFNIGEPTPEEPDLISPVINSVSFNATEVVVSGTVRITVNATDNVAVQEVIAEINGTNVTLLGTNPYVGTLNVPNSEGTYNVNVYVVDNAGLTSVNTSESITVVPIPDTESPVIGSFSILPNPVNCGNNITLSVNITDNSEVSEVIAEINGTNYSLELNSGNEYVANINIEIPLGNHSVTIIAKDIAGNKNKTNIQNITVVDSEVPVISSVTVTPNPVNVGEELSFAVVTTDNVEISSVTVNGIILDYLENNTYIVSTMGRMTPGNYSWEVKITDTSSNEKIEYVNFTVIDKEAPVLSDMVVYSSPVNLTENITIKVKVLENVEIDSVIAKINGITFEMPFMGEVDSYDAYMVQINTSNFTSSTGYFTVSVIANDTSGNSANELKSINVLDSEVNDALDDANVSIDTDAWENVNSTGITTNQTNGLNITTIPILNGDAIVIPEVEGVEINVTNITFEIIENVTNAAGLLNISEITNETGMNTTANEILGSMEEILNEGFTISNKTQNTTTQTSISGSTTTTKAVAKISFVAENTSAKGFVTVRIPIGDLTLTSVIVNNGTENITLTQTPNNSTGWYRLPVSGVLEVILVKDPEVMVTLEKTLSAVTAVTTTSSSSSSGGGSSYSSDLADGFTSTTIKNAVSNSNIVYGNSIDERYALNLRETVQNANNYEFSGDTIIVGGPEANGFANKYDSEFGISITNDYPGENKGVIQVKNIEVHVGNFIKTYQVIYIAGSDRFGTQAALQYFKTLNELPEGPIMIEWTENGPVVVE
ncbi:Ig-like domain-containing protein [Methanococcus maripaludis]|uniref:Ig-like domain-containing protein n=1 Tax=Methanococcus maripaludis TaxID=39152 RepID=UPI00286828A5|nr:Ig-like domain-containing protein [Methanococcus maripaludis]